MRYKQRFPVLVTLMLVGTAFILCAQTSGAYDDFVPEPIERVSPDGISGAGYDFYPIGWSRDGKLAYALYTNYHDGLGGCVDLSVVVQNMITDEIVDTYEYFGYEEGREFAAEWNVHKAEALPLLARYAIVPTAPRLERFPYSGGGRTIDLEFETEEREENLDEGIYGGITRFDLYAVADPGGRKRITSRVWESETGGFGAVGALGYFDSPYEERIAVVVFTLIRGWEGGNEMQLSLVGSHLSAGFR